MTYLSCFAITLWTPFSMQSYDVRPQLQVPVALAPYCGTGFLETLPHFPRKWVFQKFCALIPCLMRPGLRHTLHRKKAIRR